jgi:endonuclease/exonuclease/phosphatase family metal-dependent hydrolase
MILIQWNVQWCRGIDGVVDPQRIVDTARAMGDFDVLCLQEVPINYPDLEGSTGEDQPWALSELLVPYEPAYGVAVDAPGGQETRRRFGNMVFSRYPLQQIFRHSLPWPAHDDVPGMPRMALEVVVESPLGRLRVMTTHLEYYSDIQRSAQVERLRELHAEACGHARSKVSTKKEIGPFKPYARPESAILCGDFNMPGGTADPGYLRMQQPIPNAPRLVDAWTLANPGVAQPPTFCVHDSAHGGAPYTCDFIFVSEDLAPRVKRVAVDVETQASDHQPVLIELA